MSDKRGMKRIDLGPTGQRASERVAHFRGLRRLTYQSLADRLSSLGWPIPELGLRRIESGARRVTVDDLTALAVALDVSPLALILPPRAEEGPLPTGVPDGLTSAEVWAWSREQTALAPESRFDFWADEAARLWDEMAAYEQMRSAAQNSVARDVARKHLERAEAEHAAAAQRMEDLKGIIGG